MKEHTELEKAFGEALARITTVDNAMWEVLLGMPFKEYAEKIDKNKETEDDREE